MATDKQRAWNNDSTKPAGPAFHKARQITPQQAVEIRDRHNNGATYAELAAEYGVARSTIADYCA